MLVDLFVAIMQVTVSVTTMQLEVSVLLMQVTVSAANIWVKIFSVIMQVGVCYKYAGVFSSVHYAHNCFYSIIIMQVTVSVIAMSVTISSNNFIFLSLTDTLLSSK